LLIGLEVAMLPIDQNLSLKFNYRTLHSSKERGIEAYVRYPPPPGVNVMIFLKKVTTYMLD
jgi:hypothetical protein